VPAIIDRLKFWARWTQRDVHPLYLAGQDARLPWSARKAAAAAAAMALSPIGLVPDVVPVLRRLNDLVIVPLGIVLAVRMIPPPIMAEHRAAAARTAVQPESNNGAYVTIGIWTAMTILVAFLAYRELKT
jgi:uncharacterized membrane protein YkvA (DUF1232 family)